MMMVILSLAMDVIANAKLKLVGLVREDQQLQHRLAQKHVVMG